MPLKLFDFFQSGETKRLRAIYPDARALYEGLEKEKADAIQYLSLRISGSVIRIGKQYRLPEEEVEELLGDCISMMIQHIRDGRYIFIGNDPASYAIEIAKNRVRSISRAYKKRQTETLDPAADWGEDAEAGTWADKEFIEHLLDQLDENCRMLIRLSYLDGWKDKEIMERNLAANPSLHALKMQRSRCMRKLTDLAHRVNSNF
ncbi:MAG: hypothetical protein IPH04_19690 [Saprospirales bacterium]|nr:hypothetical protein [Saprospirales bacterium]